MCKRGGGAEEEGEGCVGTFITSFVEKSVGPPKTESSNSRSNSSSPEKKELIVLRNSLKASAAKSMSVKASKGKFTQDWL